MNNEKKDNANKGKNPLYPLNIRPDHGINKTMNDKENNLNDFALFNKKYFSV
jgi:hypothetical protein